MKVVDKGMKESLLKQDRDECVAPSPNDSDISDIEDPDLRKSLRLKRRKKQIEVILKIVLTVGGLFSISAAIGLSVIANHIRGFPWNDSLGKIIIAAWFQICYFLIIFLYQQLQKKAAFYIFVLTSIANIVFLCTLDILVLNNVIKNYQNELPPAVANAYNQIGAPVFGGTIFYLLFIGVVTAVVIRHFEIKNRVL
jgi:hypothetical protein